jgi:phosphoribosylformylglycinamidine cyclo-ligase
LIRKIISHANAKPTDLLDGRPLSDVVMEPTRLYVKSMLSALAAHREAIKGMAHITGGGLLENIPRVLPKNTTARIQRDAWEMPALFKWLQENGGVADEEMWRVFNCGIGMVVVVPAAQADAVAAHLSEQGETVYRLGEIVERVADQPQVLMV